MASYLPVLFVLQVRFSSFWTISTELKHYGDVNTLHNDVIKPLIREFHISVTKILVTDILFLPQIPIVTI